MAQSFQSLADNIAAAQPHEPYAAMVKKRHAAAIGGVEGGASAYVAAAPRKLSIYRLPFVSSTTFARESAADFRLLEPPGDQYILEPAKTIGKSNAIPLYGQARTMYVARIQNVTVESRSYILRANGVAIGDFEGDELQRYDDCLELDAGLFAVDGNQALVIDDHDAPKLEIEEAFVSLLGPHSPAFGHWIWHQLPRLILALKDGRLPDMPVLIERGMPPSHREALELVIGDRAMPIIEIPFFGRVCVANAWYAPMPFRMPYLPIPNDRWRWDFIGPSPKRFEPVLASMHKTAGRCTNSGNPGVIARRVYLKRDKSLYRVLRNAGEIEGLFRQNGFVIVDPEKLSFQEQATLMASADVVAGPEGSAFFLNFYRRPGTKLLIMCHPFTRHLTNWTATLAAYGIDTMILIGPVVPMPEDQLPPAARFGYDYFVDYEIDPARLIEAFELMGIK